MAATPTATTQTAPNPIPDNTKLVQEYETALRSGEIKTLSEFLTKHPSLPQHIISMGFVEAAKHQNAVDICKILIAHKADIEGNNPLTQEITTPALHHAAKRGHTKMVTWLLEQGADVYALRKNRLAIEMAKNTTISNLILAKMKPTDSKFVATINRLLTHSHAHQTAIQALKSQFEFALAEQQKTIHALIASSPTTLHHLVQLGDVATIKKVLPTFPLGLSEEGEVKKTKEKENSGLPVDSTADKADLTGMSFIHLTAHFTEEMAHFRKRGAIFTVNQLREAIHQYLNELSFMSPTTQRHLRQLHADVRLLLSLWRTQKLQNNDATKQLDREALILLGQHAWFEGTTDIHPACKNEELLRYLEERLRILKQSEYQRFLECTLDKDSSQALQSYLTEAVWKWWKEGQEEGNAVSSHLATLQAGIFYAELRTNKDLNEQVTTLKEALKKNLAELYQPTYQKTEQDKPLFDFFWKIVGEINQQKSSTGQPLYPNDLLKIYEDMIENIIKKWEAKTLPQEVENSLKTRIIKIMPPNQLKGNAQLDISKKAVSQLLNEYRLSIQSSITSKFSEVERTFLEKYLKDLSLTMEATEMQKNRVLEPLLHAWKKNSLSSSVLNFLDSVLMSVWQPLLDTMQQYFDPFAYCRVLLQKIDQLQVKVGIREQCSAPLSPLNNDKTSHPQHIEEPGLPVPPMHFVFTPLSDNTVATATTSTASPSPS